MDAAPSLTVSDALGGHPDGGGPPAPPPAREAQRVRRTRVLPFGADTESSASASRVDEEDEEELLRDSSSSSDDANAVGSLTADKRVLAAETKGAGGAAGAERAGGASEARVSQPVPESGDGGGSPAAMHDVVAFLSEAADASGGQAAACETTPALVDQASAGLHGNVSARSALISTDGEVAREDAPVPPTVAVGTDGGNAGTVEAAPTPMEVDVTPAVIAMPAASAAETAVVVPAGVVPAVDADAGTSQERPTNHDGPPEGSAEGCPLGTSRAADAKNGSADGGNGQHGKGRDGAGANRERVTLSALAVSAAPAAGVVMELAGVVPAVNAEACVAPGHQPAGRDGQLEGREGPPEGHPLSTSRADVGNGSADGGEGMPAKGRDSAGAHRGQNAVDGREPRQLAKTASADDAPTLDASDIPAASRQAAPDAARADASAVGPLRTDSVTPCHVAGGFMNSATTLAVSVLDRWPGPESDLLDSRPAGSPGNGPAAPKSSAGSCPRPAAPSSPPPSTPPPVAAPSRAAAAAGGVAATGEGAAIAP